MANSAPQDDKEYLHAMLREVRDVMLWKLEGLSDAEIRRPMTRSGTNLLGLVKHLIGLETNYFGQTFDRMATEVRMPWWEDGSAEDATGRAGDENGDFYAAIGESTDYIVDLYRRAWAHADRTITELDLDAVGTTPHSKETLTLRQVLVRMIGETGRHAGHADIVRELIDGSFGGTRHGHGSIDPTDEKWWQAYIARVAASSTAAE